MEVNNENCIEWISNQHSITCTFSQLKWVNKVKQLQKKHPDKVKIVAENEDGSIVAKMPINALKLSIIERELSEEKREELSKSFKKRMYGGK